MAVKPLPKSGAIVSGPGGYYNPYTSGYTVTKPPVAKPAVSAGGLGGLSPIGKSGGILTDPGVPGQTVGDYSPIPTSYGGQALDPNFQGVGAGAGTNPGAGYVNAGGGVNLNIPKFMDVLQADPMYRRAFDVYNATLQGQQDITNQRIRQAIVQGGWGANQWTPDKIAALGQFSGALDPATLAQAQANPMSQAAQLSRQNAMSQAALDYQLAGRGAGGAGTSGALTVGLQGLQNQYDTASYQGMQGLIGQLGQNISDYTGAAQQALGQRESDVSGVAQRLASMYGPVYTDQGLLSDTALSSYLKSIGYQGF